MSDSFSVSLLTCVIKSQEISNLQHLRLRLEMRSISGNLNLLRLVRADAICSAVVDRIGGVLKFFNVVKRKEEDGYECEEREEKKKVEVLVVRHNIL